MTKRWLFITKWWNNSNNGINKRISVIVDKRFNLKLMNEAFDLALFNRTKIKNGVIANDISSVVQNKFVNLECELIQVIYDYCLADGWWSVWNNSILYSYKAENADDVNKAFFILVCQQQIKCLWF